MDQAALTQVQMALECVSKDLDRTQSSLTVYEQQMISAERVTPQIKGVVDYYREQVTGLRRTMLSLCDLMTCFYKVDLGKLMAKDRREELLEQAKDLADQPTKTCALPAPPPERTVASPATVATAEEEFEDDEDEAAPEHTPQDLA